MCPLEIFKKTLFLPVRACLKWLCPSSRLRHQETKACRRGGFRPRDRPGDGGREQLSLPPCWWCYLGNFNPHRPHDRLDTSLCCYTAVSWLVPPTYSLCLRHHNKLKALFYIPFSQPGPCSSTARHRQDALAPTSGKDPSIMTSVLVVIKIKHFLEPLLPKMLMQFTFFKCDR